MPPFSPRANALMPRSISSASRVPIGINSTPNDCAAPCSAPNWPSPAGVGQLPNDRHSLHVGRDLLEQFQPFPADAVFEIHESRDVAAWSREAIDEAGGDRIGDLHKHDRHGAD